MREIKGCLRKIEGYFHEGNIQLSSYFEGDGGTYLRKFFLGKLKDIFDANF